MKKQTLASRIIFSSYWVWLALYLVTVSLATIYCTGSAILLWMSGLFGTSLLKLSLWESLKKEFRGASDAIVWPDRRCYEAAKKRKTTNA